MKVKCTNQSCLYEWDFEPIKRKNPRDTACPSCKTMIKLREGQG